jgi:amino acid transporter
MSINRNLLAQIRNPVLSPDIRDVDGNIALAILMARLFRAIILVGGLAVLLFLAMGGIGWITAGGDKGKAQEARDRITNAIIGMVALVATIAIALFISGVLGFDLLNPTLPGSGTNPSGTSGSGTSGSSNICSNNSAGQCAGVVYNTPCRLNESIPHTCRPAGNTGTTVCGCHPTQ